MLDFDRPNLCYGCGACAAACPQGRISLIPPPICESGISLPQFCDAIPCTGCGACDNACPRLHPPAVDRDAQSAWFAVQLRDPVEAKESTSGGAFYAIARSVLARGGFVCGCVWDETLTARHILTNEEQDVKRMRQTRYVRSDLTADCLRRLCDALDEGTPVLFCSVPCQVAAVQRLTGNPEQLLTVALTCHGAPEPVYWERYRRELADRIHAPMTEAIFRSKIPYGWGRSRTRYTFANGKRLDSDCYIGDPYVIAFSENLLQRGSCFDCRFKGEQHTADYLIGDAWGVDEAVLRRFPGDGVSFLVRNTQKGARHFAEFADALTCVEIPADRVRRANPYLCKSISPPASRAAFLADCEKMPLTRAIKRHIPNGRYRLKRLLRATGLWNLFFAIKRKIK